MPKRWRIDEWCLLFGDAIPRGLMKKKPRKRNEDDIDMPAECCLEYRAFEFVTAVTLH
jgi:hypothetical protein